MFGNAPARTAKEKIPGMVFGYALTTVDRLLVAAYATLATNIWGKLFAPMLLEMKIDSS